MPHLPVFLSDHVVVLPLVLASRAAETQTDDEDHYDNQTGQGYDHHQPRILLQDLQETAVHVRAVGDPIRCNCLISKQEGNHIISSER